jgi:hypothetical protein
MDEPNPKFFEMPHYRDRLFECWHLCICGRWWHLSDTEDCDLELDGHALCPDHNEEDNLCGY